MHLGCTCRMIGLIRKSRSGRTNQSAQQCLQAVPAVFCEGFMLGLKIIAEFSEVCFPPRGSGDETHAVAEPHFTKDFWDSELCFRWKGGSFGPITIFLTLLLCVARKPAPSPSSEQDLCALGHLHLRPQLRKYKQRLKACSDLRLR